MRGECRKRGVWKGIGKRSVADKPRVCRLVSSPLPVVRTTLPPPPTIKFKRSETCVCIRGLSSHSRCRWFRHHRRLYQPVFAASVKLVRGDIPNPGLSGRQISVRLKTSLVAEFGEPSLLKLCELPDTDNPIAFSAFS